jgi:uncharacterized membrane protein
MAYSNVLSGAGLATRPAVRKITIDDLKEALARGLDDFRAMPSHAVFLCLIYPIVGFVLFRLAIGANVLPLLFPLAAGFALIGPFAAIGLYEMSRRREEGLDTTWYHAFDVFHSPSFGAILALGLLLVAIFLTWLAVAQAIYVAYFGYTPASEIPNFIQQVLTTPAGWSLIVVGNGVGFLLALLVLTLSVVTFPLLLDRDVGAAVAVLTSIRAVAANPATMAVWGLIVAALLLLGSIPVFFGLAVVMPLLGHATWHLYRKVVDPAGTPRNEYHDTAKGRRYAAQFPASLLPWGREDRG